MTIRRDDTSAITSISTRLLAFSVLPLATKNPFNIYMNALSLLSQIKAHNIGVMHARSRAPAAMVEVYVRTASEIIAREAVSRRASL